MVISAIKGGGGRLIANAIKNFHILFGNTSLIDSKHSICQPDDSKDSILRH